MNDSDVRQALSLIETGEVRWRTASISLRFYTGGWVFDGTSMTHEPEIDLPEIASLSERLYHRQDFDIRDYGMLVLTDEGRRILAELNAETRSIYQHPSKR